MQLAHTESLANPSLMCGTGMVKDRLAYAMPWCNHSSLREFVKLMSSWPLVCVKVGLLTIKLALCDTTLPGLEGLARSADEFQKVRCGLFLQRVWHNWVANFQWIQKMSHSSPRCPRTAKGIPKNRTGNGNPRAPQGEPKEAQRKAKGAQSQAKGGQRRQKTTRGTNYINKLPINCPSGCYV